MAKTVELDVPDWAALRDKQDYIRQQQLMQDDEKMRETDERLSSSVADAIKVMEEKAAKVPGTSRSMSQEPAQPPDSFMKTIVGTAARAVV